MSVQTTYNRQEAQPAFDGMRYDSNPVETYSRTVEETNGVTPGRVVSVGSSDEQVSLAGAAREGVMMRGSISYEGDVVPDKFRAAIMVKGNIWAKVNGTGSKGDALTYDNVTGEFNTGVVGGTLVDAKAELIKDHATAGAVVGVKLL